MLEAFLSVSLAENIFEKEIFILWMQQAGIDRNQRNLAAQC